MTELSPVGTMTAANDEVLGSCGILLPNSQGTIHILLSSFLGKGRPEKLQYLPIFSEAKRTNFLKIDFKLNLVFQHFKPDLA